MTVEAYEHALEFEYPSCEICRADDRRLVAHRTDLLLGGDHVYSMYQCRNCGVFYQYPRPTPDTIEHVYPPEYQQFTPAVHTEHPIRQWQRRYSLRKRCEVVTRHVNAGRLLDVGCATGDFLSEMTRLPGWTVVGVEPNHFAASYARSHVGVDIVEGTLNDAPFAPNSFDAITMWDVLEHVYSPRRVIREAAQLLNTDGVLVVNHPNVDSFDRSIFSRLWLGYELPRHLYLFPTEVLRRLMAEYGLREVERRCVYGSHAATSTSTMFAVERLFGNGMLSRLIELVLFSVPVRMLLIPYFKVIDALRRGSNVTTVFRKMV